MNLYMFILGTIVGFFIAKLFSGRKEGEEGLFKSLKFNIKNYIIHLHHWLLALLMLIILAVVDFYMDLISGHLIYGILLGLIIQGLTYRDFYKIVYTKR